MKLAIMSAEDREFLNTLNYLKKHDNDGYIAVTCMVVSCVGVDVTEAPEIHGMLSRSTRGTFKRAIKYIREIQNKAPEYQDVYDCTVEYIRREWLRKEVAC